MTTGIAPLGAPIPPITSELSPTITPSPTVSGAPSFGDRIESAIGEVQQLQDNAVNASEGYMRGDHQDVHGTMIAMQEADVSLRLMASVRNRAIEAYREVMRMGS